MACDDEEEIDAAIKVSAELRQQSSVLTQEEVNALLTGVSKLDVDINADEALKAEKLLDAIRSMSWAMKALGLDLNDPDLHDTPGRFVKYLLEYMDTSDLQSHLGNPFENQSPGTRKIDEMIVQTKIPFRGICAHHLLPFFGTCDIGYIPDKRLVGLSKLSRLVRACGVYKPSLQEDITELITDNLVEGLQPKGVIVVTKAEHTCMASRGVVAPGVITTTSSIRGLFRDAPQTKTEFFSLCKG